MSDLSYLGKVKAERLAERPAQKTMKAVVTRGNGGYDKLDYCDVPVPRLYAGEVLIRVLAAGVNNTEINTRLGWYSDSVQAATEDSAVQSDSIDANLGDGGWNAPTPFPLIQGTDCCGQVVDVAPDVDKAWLERRVLVRPCMRLNGFDSLDHIWMASDFDGAFAEYVAVPASEVFAVNSSWSNAELATIPCAYGTAENMIQRADVREGEKVLVVGASGGVGSAVVQLAKRRGAFVVAMAGKDKMSMVAGIGADQVIDRGKDISKILDDNSVDVVFDNVAGDGFASMLKLLRPGGRYASSGAIAGPVVTMDMRQFYLKDLNLIGCTAWDEAVFASVISAIENEDIKPLLAASFVLKDIVKAQKQFMQKQHVGNFVLLPPTASD